MIQCAVNGLNSENAVNGKFIMTQHLSTQKLVQESSAKHSIS